MIKPRIVFKILYSYLLVGLIELWTSVGFILLRDGYLNYQPLTGVLTIFFWPIVSFFSSLQLFGQEGAQIWNYISLSQIFLFVAFLAYLLRISKR